MKRFLGRKNARRNWKVTLLWLAICCVSVTAGLLGHGEGGLSLTRVLLLLAAGCSLILAFVHTWRKLGKFLILYGVSVVGFALGVFLHNYCYALGIMTADIIVLHYIFELLHVAFFLIAIFVCPAFFLVGAVGSAVMCFKIALTSTKMSRKVIFILAAICCIAPIVVFFMFFPLFN